MILQSLYRYYEILRTDPEVEIALPGYSTAKVSFALNISSKGELSEIFPFTTNYFDGRRERELNYRNMIVPEQVKRSSGVNPNFLCDNTTYILGISTNDNEKPDYSKVRFEAFRERNTQLLIQANSDNARVVVSFLNNHNPKIAQENPLIAQNLEDLLKGGNLIFMVEGKSTLEDPEILRVWEESRLENKAIEMQCLVTGEIEPIARLHPSIKGVQDAQSSGASLISFNSPSFASYNRNDDQGLNSPVSQRVTSGYTTALNYLLSIQNPNRKFMLGDSTVVYWAESENKHYAQAFATLINPDLLEDEPADEQMGRREAETRMSRLAEKVRVGQPVDVGSVHEGLSPETRFFVLGLAPNASRLAVRFFLTEPFGRFVERIMLHYEDLKIEKEFANQPEYLSPYRILAECVSPKVTRKDDELKATWGLMGGALMRSILTGAPYPEGLYAAIINRVRHDSDEEGRSRKINYIRAAFIKAHLLRKYRQQPFNPYLEVLQMSLNENYTHPAYVLGRLFAWLEKAQIEAIGDVNAGIKDRYFTSACAAPASVFPVLLRLSHHHTAKAEYGKSLDWQIQQTLNLLDAKPFPARLTLDEQGIFILGYYHQRGNFYAKNSGSTAEKEPTN